MVCTILDLMAQLHLIISEFVMKAKTKVDLSLNTLKRIDCFASAQDNEQLNHKSIKQSFVLQKQDSTRLAAKSSVS